VPDVGSAARATLLSAADRLDCGTLRPKAVWHFLNYEARVQSGDLSGVSPGDSGPETIARVFDALLAATGCSTIGYLPAVLKAESDLPAVLRRAADRM
jgi:hypothetical protein